MNNYNIIIIQGYTNADNPFGDQHLLDKFVWAKVNIHELIIKTMNIKLVTLIT